MKIFKNKYFILLAIEAAAVLAVIVAMCLPKYNKNYSPQDVNLLMGKYLDNGSIYTDNTINPAGIILTTPEMDLGYGTYEIDIDYVASDDGNMAYITLPDIMEGKENINGRFSTNTAVLSNDNVSDSIEVLVKLSQKDYKIAVFYSGNGGLIINNISIRQTNAGLLRIGIILITLFAIIDAALIYCRRRKENKISDEAVQTGFLLLGITVFASIPLMIDYLIAGHDLSFHLLRIEGIKEGLLMGIFPIKIQPNWLNGNGYATSVFYGDILLYVPAILRLCGFNITESYNIFVFMINLATCLVSYYCFLGISKNRKAALAGSAIYTLSMYRMINMYVRSAVGEYSAMIFLPLIVYGMWKIFSEDIDSSEYKKNWLLPVIGFFGIINTHILSCEMAGAFIILLCLILIKKVFRKKTFIVLVKVVAYTCIINLGFLVPFIDYMLTGEFVITSRSLFESGIQQFGAFVGQLFVPFTTYSGLTLNTSDGMAGEIPTTAGLAVVLGAVVTVYTLMINNHNDKKEKTFVGICMGFGLFSMWLSTHLFPWDVFQEMNGLFRKLISTIQYPWRFLSIAAVVLTFSTVASLAALDKNKKNINWLIAAMVSICVIQAGSLMSNIMNSAAPLNAYTDNALNDEDIIGGEYLPNLGDTELYAKQYAVASDNMELTLVERVNNRMLLNVNNNSAESGSLHLSMVYYKGYSAKDVNTGECFEVYPETGYTLGVIVPAGYSGEMVVEFTGFWYWKLASVISIAAFLGMIAYAIKGGYNGKSIFSK